MREKHHSLNKPKFEYYWKPNHEWQNLYHPQDKPLTTENLSAKWPVTTIPDTTQSPAGPLTVSLPAWVSTTPVSASPFSPCIAVGDSVLRIY